MNWCEPGDETSNYLRALIKKKQVTANGVVFEMETDDNGAYVQLIRESHHTDEDMKVAKMWANKTFHPTELYVRMLESEGVL